MPGTTEQQPTRCSPASQADEEKKLQDAFFLSLPLFSLNIESAKKISSERHDLDAPIFAFRPTVPPAYLPSSPFKNV
ncbi:hypothetical protein E2C01_081974 [Portunus trituberculatus]|uniref:Uncharacterized protein n=1 Tax=Portunus trituberculatus TaxID=210409 RepID=A0A5B7IY06_PORTR|nr:hypothetical protein [Portunus trituberculatus]